MADVRIKVNPKNPSKGAHKFDQGSVLSVLLKTALPIVILMLFNSTYAFVDSLMSATYVQYGCLSDGTVLNGGTIVGLLLPLMGVLIAFEVMIAVGCGLAYTQSMAQEDYEEANKRHNESMSAIIYMGLIVILVIAIIGIPYTLTVSGNWQGKAWEGYTRQMVMDGYLYIIILGFSFIPMQIQQSYIRVLRAEGVGDVAAIIPILTFPINIFFDWLFMNVLQTGVYGAGIATLIASMSGSIIMAIYIHRQELSDKLVINLNLPKMIVHREVIMVVLAFAMGSLLRRLCDSGTVVIVALYIGNADVSSMTGSLSNIANWTGGWTVMTRSINMAIMLSLGVAQTVSMLVSYYANSNQMNKVGDTIKYGFISMIICSLFASLLLFGLQGILFVTYDATNSYGWEWWNPMSIAFILALIYSIPLSLQPMPVMFYAGMKQPKLTLIHSVTYNIIVLGFATFGLVFNLQTGNPLYLYWSLLVGSVIGLFVILLRFNSRYKELNLNKVNNV